MKITRDNYEIYFMDYLDGNLSNEDIQELKAFLLINRDIEETLDEIEAIQFIPKAECFSDKESLKKEAYHECPDYYAIAASENELTAQDLKVLGKRINAPLFQSEVADYKQFRLHPDPAIRFEKKNSLYRKSKILPFYRIGGVAAGILLLLGMAFLFRQAPSVVSPETSIKTRSSGMAEIHPGIQAENNPHKAASEKTQKTHSPSLPAREKKRPVEQEEQTREMLPPLPIPPLQASRLPNKPWDEKCDLKIQKLSTPEIYLTVNARQWKPSGEDGLFSETIIALAIESGKKLTERIKERITISTSNKTTEETVIGTENNQTEQP